MNSKVSIIIPTFKRPERVVRAVESVLKQDYDNYEIIVVDDNDPNSKERKETSNNLQKYSKLTNFIYIEHSENKNGSAARNTGIRNSNGKYITFLDDDDEYYENKLRIQANCLDSIGEEWGLCYTSYEKIDRFGNRQYSLEKSEGNLYIQALSKNLFIGSGSNFMIRKSVIDKIGVFDETFIRNQDLEFLVRALKSYKIKYVDEITFLIHNEVREMKFSYKDLKVINENYRLKFNSYISSLSTKDRILVNKYLDLIDFKTAISCLNLKGLYEVIRRSSYSLKELLEFIFYLIKRTLTKTSYGFKFKEVTH
ncbi:glycosyltransferase family 2 protein [Facklamia sp. 7083-14-GEN3]|uniref:glycosyltransferase family 2 protein n=1 Tax=Facklamia sp. 7083-14-GEN3 TaxID=2973478 RepID=UPI00215CEB03|nr:glycosyltransferase family 2 protein [Facklamia sp. 7083-14-GEN3]MCR8968938.1 glycosyltransferase [Facklamia sp. 7083-14-GEN3]